MIISREYIPFKTLVTERDKGGELFTRLCKEAYPEDMWNVAYLMLGDYALYQREMEWGFRRMRDLIEGFRKLDEEDPYETGYDLKDAHTADVIWRDENTMMFLLRTSAERGHAIVGIVEANTLAKVKE